MAPDETEQEALFYIEGPDERGSYWRTDTRNPWSQNLGPARKVACVLAEWLASLDFEEDA